MEIVEAPEDEYCQLVGLTTNTPMQPDAAQTIGSSSCDESNDIEIVEVRQGTTKV